MEEEEWVQAGLVRLIEIAQKPRGAGLIISGYVGSFLMAGAYLAIACLTSSMTKKLRMKLTT